MHKLMVSGRGTRDLSGPSGATTEEFISSVSKYLDSTEPIETNPDFVPQAKTASFDKEKVKVLYERLDKNKDGSIDFNEFVDALVLLNIQPKTIDEANKSFSE